MIGDIPRQRRFDTNCLGIADMLPKLVRPTSPRQCREFPVTVNTFFSDTIGFLHVLVVEFRHEEERRLPRTNQEEEGSFKRLEAGSSQVVEAVKGRDDEQI